MVNFCAVFGCGNKAGKDSVSFFVFPHVNSRFSQFLQELQKKRLHAWLTALKREDLNENNCRLRRVCSRHFLSGKPSHLTDVDNPDWVPCIQLGHKKTKTVKDAQRYARCKNREEAKEKTNVQMEKQKFPEDNPSTHDEAMQEPECLEQDQIIVSSEMCSSETAMNSSTQTTTEKSNQLIQTELTMELLSEMEKQAVEANTKMYCLREKVQNLELSEESFLSDKEKLHFYTGLPEISIFNVVFNLVAVHLTFTQTSSLTKFQQVLLTLMKLRLNLSFIDLGYRFGVSRHTASRIFYNCLDVLQTQLRRFVLWPERSELTKTTPKSFIESFGTSVSVIIDCFEIFIERPANLMARAQTWSHYKHHNTVKFLIGICPQGVICFISQGWGGRTSDKYITENCGILDLLLPGDVVLADRGFNIAQSVAYRYAVVKIPAFTKGKKQLDPLEVEETRSIASVRIHVERVIGTIKQKYKILSGPLPIGMLNCTADKIVTVCCALTNLCPSVVPL